MKRKGRRGEPFREERHEQCLQQQTSHSVSDSLHLLTSSMHLAEGADHVPVSQHAAAAPLSMASHYRAILDWPVHAFTSFHSSTPPGEVHSLVCRNSAFRVSMFFKPKYHMAVGVAMRCNTNSLAYESYNVISNL